MTTLSADSLRSVDASLFSDDSICSYIPQCRLRGYMLEDMGWSICRLRGYGLEDMGWSISRLGGYGLEDMGWRILCKLQIFLHPPPTSIPKRKTLEQHNA